MTDENESEFSDIGWWNKEAIKKIRTDAIEECARVVHEQESWAGLGTTNAIAAAIRALKDKP